MATLLYDGDCGFCTTSAAFIERRIPTRATVIAYQYADLATLGVTEEQAAEELQWVADDGTVSAGHAAIARLLTDAGGLWSVPGRIMLVPPLSWLAAVAYRLTAANRHRLPGGTAACALPPRDRPGAPV
jgi:predicted DCC family thiol-disulfide oxidoreductase YuxK